MRKNVTNLELVMAEAPVVKVRGEKERRGKGKGKRKNEQVKVAKKNLPSRRSW